MLCPIGFDPQSSVRNVNDVAFLGQSAPASGEVVALVLASMLRKPSGVGTGKDERVPTMIVFLAVVDVRP